MRILTIIFFFCIILNSIVWIFLVPMWHTPDEQSHFSQVAFLAEKGRNPRGSDLDVTSEIYTAEQLLGTARDKVGNNKFTFHPEYKIEYTTLLIGKYEASISALTKTDAKRQFVYQEASRYPKLYYIPASWIYQFFYNQDIFTRVFAIRIWSAILFILNTFVVYLLGNLLFGKNKIMTLTLSMLVGFAPMMVFSNIGVTSDSLANLLFSIFLYICLRLVVSGLNIKDGVILTLTTVALLNSKIQFIIILPALFVLIFFLLLRDSKKLPVKLFGMFIIISAFIILYLYFIRFGPLIYSLHSLQKFNFASFIKFTLEYTLPHTYREVLPWYWGVYKWLGLTYPRVIYRIINGITFIGLLGFIGYVLTVIKKRKWTSRNVQCGVYLLGVSFLYFTAISVYDWLSWYTSGFQLGVQGRYFFPLISVFMIIILIGLNEFLSFMKHKFPLIFLGLLMIIFNLYGLYTVANAYYDVSNTQQFIFQISQYKPYFIKAPFNIVIFFLFLVSLIIFVYKYMHIYIYDKSK